MDPFRNRTINLSYREWESWVDFKEALEAEVGLYLPVNLWLEIRPKRPLPWHSGDFQSLVDRITGSESIRSRASAQAPRP